MLRLGSVIVYLEYDRVEDLICGNFRKKKKNENEKKKKNDYCYLIGEEKKLRVHGGSFAQQLAFSPPRQSLDSRMVRVVTGVKRVMLIRPSIPSIISIPEK